MAKSKTSGEQDSFDDLTTSWTEGRLSGFVVEAAGVLLLAGAAITILALTGLTDGSLLDPWVRVLRRWMGWGSVLVVLGLAFAGWRLLLRSRGDAAPEWGRVVAIEIAAFAFLGLLSLAWGHSLERAEMGLDGGLVGWGISASLTLLFGTLLPDWAALLLAAVVLLGLFAFGALFALARVGRVRDWMRRDQSGWRPEQEPVMSVSSLPGEEEQAEDEVNTLRKPRKSSVSAEFRKDFNVEEQAMPGKAPPRPAELPSLDLLMKEKTAKADERHINQSAGLLEKTLSEFGLPAKVVGYKVGPTVTQFAVEPGYVSRGSGDDSENRQKVRVSQISALKRDLALALSAQRLRIQAPVPGRSYVGVEVPNSSTTVVRLRAILESESFHKIKSPLAIALGRDVSGAPVAADLAKMPHLLVAGTTGSGKSVLISAITACLAMNNSPEDLQLVMIDPKMVELVRFNGLPHLMGKVETELERITAVLRWVVSEMQRRYQVLEEAKVRDLEAYNRKARRRKSEETLPNIVVLIDELADLMMNAAEHTESTLVRLAQMARATGIHLVVATQRPSTDVVTGLIKANFPARISFAVASAVDSRVILDVQGAEALLGRGDMLYLAPEAAAPMRSQGVMITDQEIENVIAYWQDKAQTEEESEAPWEEMIQKKGVLSDYDDLVEDAINEIKASGKSSASHLQRALRIGYPRAARLVDELEEMGILGPNPGGGRERDVLIDLDDDDFDLEEQL